MPEKIIKLLLLLSGGIPLAFWILNYAQVDLWYDEVYSFQHFVFVGLSDTLFNYPLPNNHVFYNLINQVLTRLINCRDIYKMIDYIVIFRALQLIITLCIAYYSLKFTKRFFNFKYSLLVLPVLFTTIPFMNFSLQLRGYNLSALFVIMIVYHTWSFIVKESKRDRNYVIISTALLVYTIPSNIYVVSTLLLTFLGYWLLLQKSKRAFGHIYFKSFISILIGVVLAIVLYSPIIQNVVTNPFTVKRTENPIYSLEMILTVTVAFLSNRTLILVPFLVGSWFMLRTFENQQKRIFMSLVLLIFLPFIISFVHQKIPFERTFVIIAPIFAIALSIPLTLLLEKITSSIFRYGFTIFISVYCIISFFVTINSNEKIVKQNLIEKEKITQNCYRNYYLSSVFNLRETSNLLKSISKNKTIFMFEQLDYPATYAYLSKNNLHYIHTENQSEIITETLKINQVFVVTSYPLRVTAELNNSKLVNAKLVSTKYPFSSIISVKKK